MTDDWMYRWGYLCAGVLTLTALFWISPARAEWVLSLYGGISNTPDTDVQYTAPGDTDLTFKNISWREDSFRAPPYFGLRLTYWIDRTPHWGVAIDFTHDKILSNQVNAVRVTGTRNGQAVDTIEPLNNTLTHLEFSHGHNLLTANLFYRWFLNQRGFPSLFHHLQLYIGSGIGAAIPHVEVDVANTKTAEYQVAGFAAQGLIGLNIDIISHLSLFIETKLSYADIDAELARGQTVSVNPWTHHVAFGLSLSY